MLNSLGKITTTLTLATLISACGGATNSSELIAVAQQHLAQGQLSEATIQLKNALKQDPQSISARLILADIYLQQGTWKKAIKELRKAQDPSQPLPAEYQIKLAKAYFFSGDSRELTKMADARSNLGDEQRLVIYVYAALALMQENQPDSGNSYLLKAQEISQSATFSDLGLAYKDALSENYQQALQSVETLLKRAPDLDAALTLKAGLYSALERHEDAADSFAAFLEKHPEASQQRLLYASALTAAKQFPKAKVEIEYLLERYPNHPLANELHAEILYDEKQFQAAKTAAEKAISGGLGSIKNHLIAGVSALNLGRQEQGYQHIRQIEKSLPQNHQLMRVLANLKLKLGYVDEVTEMLSGISPETQIDAELYSNTSIALARQGKLDDASHYAAVAENLAPDNSQVLLQRGQLKLAANQKGAVNDILKALEVDPENSAALLSLVRELVKNKQYQQALDAVKGAEAADPTVRKLLEGDIYRAQKQIDQARQAYTEALTLSPQSLGARTYLAMLDELSGQPEKALQQYGVLLNENPGHGGIIRLLINQYRRQPEQRAEVQQLLTQQRDRHPLTAITLSMLQQQQGDIKGAEQSISAALQKFSNNSALLNRLGDLQLQQQAYADAVNSFERSLQTEANQPNIWLKKLAGLEAQKLTNSAHSELQRARRETQNASVLDLAEVSLYLSEDELSKAATQLEQFKANHGSVMGYHILNSRLASKRGDSKGLVEHQEAIFRASPNLNSAKSLINAYIANQDYSKALALIGKMQQQMPENEGLKLAKGEVLLKSDPQAAQKHYEGLIQQSPTNPVVLNNLAHIYLQDANHYADAIKLSKQALQLMPEHPAIQETLAHAYLVSGESQQAVSIYRKLQPGVLKTPEIQLRYIQALMDTGKSALARELLLQLDSTRLNSQQQQQLAEVKQALTQS